MKAKEMNIGDEIGLISKLKDAASSMNGRLFNAYISGSNLYGWSSKDSDIDIRGSFVLRKEEFLGLQNPKETLDIKGIESLDVVLFEIKKLITLALKGNCNILEEINAPQIYKTADFIKLRQLINNSFGKSGIYNSYKGLAEFNYKKFILNGRNTIKKYLYVFRGLMAGIYVLQTGIIQPNMEELNKHFKIKEVNKLLKIKREGLENEPLKDLEEGCLDRIIKELFDKIDEAYAKSKIPELPDKEDVEKINKFLISLRMQE
ncbi:MAG TPA: nucleotidyltransferase domain-containing protein [Candidatus Nanoarchaeia archaeon]|nr:nucleotidyltransferase domain-containing protein [Candidatus Nanoarchaeia archaeon]